MRLCIFFCFQSDTYTDDFGLLSVVGTDLVSPSTLTFYICQQYSLVFVVDMSTNMMAVVSVVSRTPTAYSSYINIIMYMNEVWVFNLFNI